MNKIKQIEKENIELQVKLAACMNIFNSYFDAFYANTRQVIDITYDGSAAKVDRKTARKIMRQKQNAIVEINKEDKRIKQLLKTYSQMPEGMDEALLDCFNSFFENKIKIEGTEVCINLEDAE